MHIKPIVKKCVPTVYSPHIGEFSIVVCSIAL